MGADRSPFPRLAAGTDVFDIAGRGDFQSRSKLHVALTNQAFEQWRVESRADHPARLHQGTGMFDGLPAACIHQKAFGEFNPHDERLTGASLGCTGKIANMGATAATPRGRF
jgi:hypothetical protein